MHSCQATVERLVTFFEQRLGGAATEARMPASRVIRSTAVSRMYPMPPWNWTQSYMIPLIVSAPSAFGLDRPQARRQDVVANDNYPETRSHATGAPMVQCS